jgi:hypothetical protein
MHALGDFPFVSSETLSKYEKSKSKSKTQRKMQERKQNKTNVSSTLSIRSKGAKGIPKMLERKRKMEKRKRKERPR